MSYSLKGVAITVVLVVGPALLAYIAGGAAPPLAIPGDLSLFAVIYTGWVHHRLRPWCPYCGRWEDDGHEEPSPDPNVLNTKTGT